MGLGRGAPDGTQGSGRRQLCSDEALLSMEIGQINTASNTQRKYFCTSGGFKITNYEVIYN